jgi:hypothetical protein
MKSVSKLNGQRSYNKSKLTNSMALVRERTIQTERPPLVGEVSANLFDLIRTEFSKHLRRRSWFLMMQSIATKFQYVDQLDRYATGCNTKR